MEILFVETKMLFLKLKMMLCKWRRCPYSKNFTLEEARKMGSGRNKWGHILESFTERFGSVRHLSVSVLKVRYHRMKRRKLAASTTEISNASTAATTMGRKPACDVCKMRKRRCDGTYSGCLTRLRMAAGPMDQFV